jgi:hypothetical protein
LYFRDISLFNLEDDDPRLVGVIFAVGFTESTVYFEADLSLQMPILFSVILSFKN